MFTKGLFAGSMMALAASSLLTRGGTTSAPGPTPPRVKQAKEKPANNPGGSKYRNRKKRGKLLFRP